MAIDIYMRIDGIKGESSDDTHREWIEVSFAEWGVVQPRSAASSTSGGHTAERVEMEEVTVIKYADLASPILLQACSMGKTFPGATLEFMRADGNGVRVKYFEMQLENVLIGHVAAAVQPGHLLAESIGLKFSKAKWKYTQQKIGGGIAGVTTGGWDLATNRIAA